MDATSLGRVLLGVTVAVTILGIEALAQTRRIEGSNYDIDQALDSKERGSPATLVTSPAQPGNDLLLVYRRDYSSALSDPNGILGSPTRGKISIENDTGEPIEVVVDNSCETGKGIDAYNKCSATRQHFEYHAEKAQSVLWFVEPTDATSSFVDVKAVSLHHGTIWFRAQGASRQNSEYVLICGPMDSRGATQTYPKEPAAKAHAVGLPDLIEAKIDQIGSGPHQNLPEPQMMHAANDQNTGWDITNQTGYTLHVYLVGPVSRNIEIQAGESGAIELPTGRYRVAAEVSDPNVVPYYKELALGVETRWRSMFYIH